jgi:hypothetical protein
MQGLDQLKKDLQPHYCEHGHGVCDGLLVCSDVLKDLVKLVEPEDAARSAYCKGVDDAIAVCKDMASRMSSSRLPGAPLAAIAFEEVETELNKLKEAR